MLIRNLLKTRVLQSTKQTLADDCCKAPAIDIKSSAPRYRGAATKALVFCANCETEILEISVR